jgi:hypothetical protein
MKKAFFEPRIILIKTIGCLLVPFFYISACGIYTTFGALDSPFGLQIDTNTLTFSGHNTEGYFSGYIIYYKEAGTEKYLVCKYKEVLDKPTIPLLPLLETSPAIEITVKIEDLKPMDSNQNFIYLNNFDGQKYYFAVSAYGTDGQEREKVEFGIWPVS